MDMRQPPTMKAISEGAHARAIRRPKDACPYPATTAGPGRMGQIARWPTPEQSERSASRHDSCPGRGHDLCRRQPVPRHRAEPRAAAVEGGVRQPVTSQPSQSWYATGKAPD
jgi:hypothetical protein